MEINPGGIKYEISLRSTKCETFLHSIKCGRGSRSRSKNRSRFERFERFFWKTAQIVQILLSKTSQNPLVSWGFSPYLKQDLSSLSSFERFIWKHLSKTAKDWNGLKTPFENRARFERFLRCFYQINRSKTAQDFNGFWAVYLEKTLKNRSNLARFLSGFF